MSELTVSKTPVSLASPSATAATAAPMNLPVSPKDPLFGQVAVRVLSADKTISKALLGEFAKQTGIGMMLDGRSGRIKSVDVTSVNADSLDLHVVVAEYSAFKSGIVERGTSAFYSVKLQGAPLAALIQALEAEPRMQKSDFTFG